MCAPRLLARGTSCNSQRNLANFVRATKNQLARARWFRQFAPATSVFAARASAGAFATLQSPGISVPWMADTPTTNHTFLDAKTNIAPSETTFWPDFMRWTPSSPHKLREVEQKLLSRTSHVDVPDTTSPAVVKTPHEQFFVDIGDNRYINTIKLGSGPPLVMIHGWAGASGIFVPNFDELAKHHTVYAIDLIGFGRSSRPPFNGKTPQDAEAWFIESIESWRKSIGLNQFALLGHSMGGYLSGIYALTYPDRISQLVLADPWGVPAPPPGWEERIPMKWRILAKVINSLVVSPLSLLRAAGPLGPPLVMRTRPDLAAKFQRLFENADPSQRNVGVEYIYHINAQRPSSGEAAFRAMLTDFAWAAKPLLYRLPMLDPKVPVTLVYGDNTWMDPRAGYQLKQQLLSPAKMVVLPNAGHHVYIDAPDLFTKVVVMGIKGTLTDITEEQVEEVLKKRNR